MTSRSSSKSKAFCEVVVIDIGAPDMLASVPDSVLDALATHSLHALITTTTRQERIEQLQETVRRTFPAFPWPRKASNGNVRGSRMLELLPGAVFVDPLTRRLLRGFRVESGQDDVVEDALFVLRRRTLRAIMLAPIYPLEEHTLKNLTGLVFSRVAGVQGMELIYYETPAGNTESALAEQELREICKTRYGLNGPPQTTKLWEIVDGVNGEWLYVGLDTNARKTIQVVFDPGALAVFIFSDVELARTEAVPMDEKRKRILERLTAARGAKIPFELATPMLVNSEMSEADATSRALFREEKCGRSSVGHDVLEDAQSFAMNALVAEWTALGVYVLELETVCAARPRCTVDVDAIEDSVFFWYQQRCRTLRVEVAQTNLRRIAACLLRMAENGVSSFHPHVHVYADVITFDNAALFPQQ